MTSPSPLDRLAGPGNVQGHGGAQPNAQRLEWARTYVHDDRQPRHVIAQRVDQARGHGGGGDCRQRARRGTPFCLGRCRTGWRWRRSGPGEWTIRGRPGPGCVRTDDQERPHRERRSGPVTRPRRADARPWRADGCSLACSMRTCTTRERGSTPVTKRVESREPSRLSSCRRRLRGAPRRCHRASSSPASAAGTTHSSSRDDGRRRRNWMRPRPGMPSTSPAPAEGPARSQTAWDARS